MVVCHLRPLESQGEALVHHVNVCDYDYLFIKTYLPKIMLNIHESLSDLEFHLFH